tara:strand:- start:115 stop:621 length:507 start_codon:yes stop_codon:yes gene_type:complete
MKLIPGYTEYSITTDGRVFSHKKPNGKGKGKILDYSYKRELKPQKNKKGYLNIILEQNKNTDRMRNTTIHRLVAETYIPNPYNYDTINHINEDKEDNRVENLEWMSRADNVEYSQAKIRLIETPTGETIEVFNLTKWCREVLGLKSSGNMLRSLRNPQMPCKGYRLVE